MTKTDLERHLELEKTYKSSMSDDELAVFCEQNGVVTEDWTLQWNGMVGFRDYRIGEWRYITDEKFYAEGYSVYDFDPDEYYQGHMHLLLDAAQKGEAGLLRIPEQYRKTFTAKDFDQRHYYNEGGHSDSPWE